MLSINVRKRRQCIFMHFRGQFCPRFITILSLELDAKNYEFVNMVNGNAK